MVDYKNFFIFVYQLTANHMKYQVLKSEDITPKHGSEDYEYICKVEKVTLYSDRHLDQHELAYEVFKNAKFVSVLDKAKMGDNWMYEIKVTYPSMEEREYEMAYGDDYNDFND